MVMVKHFVKMSSKNDSFLLQWKDIDVSLSKVLNDIRKESDFCDIVLVCSDSTERYLQGPFDTFLEVFLANIKKIVA